MGLDGDFVGGEEARALIARADFFLADGTADGAGIASKRRVHTCLSRASNARLRSTPQR